MSGWARGLTLAFVACSAKTPPTEPHAPAPVAERCLPVLECGDCPGPCAAGSTVEPFVGTVTIRQFCVGATCTDVFDPHRPCKDMCAPTTTIDTSCHFDAQHRCVSGS